MFIAPGGYLFQLVNDTHSVWLTLREGWLQTKISICECYVNSTSLYKTSHYVGDYIYDAQSYRDLKRFSWYRVKNEAEELITASILILIMCS